MAAVPAAVLASPEDVIRDYREADGEVENCYPAEDFDGAIRLLNPQDRLYDDSVGVILTAKARCARAAGGAAGGDEGSGIGIWIGIIVAVGVVAIGAGVLSRRRTGGGGDSSGPDWE